QHRLRGVEAEAGGDVLQRVDGGAVDVGLARFAEPAVAGRDAVAFEQARQRRRAAVHGGGLDDLGREEATRVHGGYRGCISRPAWRSTRARGEACSTCTSTVPGRPCWSGICGAPPRPTSNSTRSPPASTSDATRATVAGMLP